jgi:hypothetical protein
MSNNKKTETTKSTENIWTANPMWEAFNAYTPDTYKDACNRWMDAVDSYTTQVKGFQHAVMEKTSQAWDEAYKMAREGFDRGADLINSVHEMTTQSIESFKKQM